MKLSESVKPITYFKAHASEAIREVTENRKPLVITQKGEAKVVILDVREYDELQETLSLLRLLSMSQQDVTAGRVEPLDRVFDQLRQELPTAEEK